MKRTLVILALVMLMGAALTSCTASRGGCKGTAGMVGYGSR